MAQVLKNYVEGRFVEGQGNLVDLVNPTSEAVVAQTSSTGIDFGSAVAPPHSLLTIAAPLEAYAESGWFSHPFT